MIEGRSSADPLLGLGVDEADSEAWSSELRVELGELTEELLAEGPPPLGSLFEHVFAEPTDRLREQAEGLSAHLARFASGEID